MRTGDKVRHKPSGEIWTVAYADEGQGRLAYCGWPPGTVDLSTCELVEAIDDAGHWKLVREIALPSMGNDARAVYCRRLLAKELGQTEESDASARELDDLAKRIQQGQVELHPLISAGHQLTEQLATILSALNAGYEAVVQLQGARLALRILEQRRASALSRLYVSQRWARRWKQAAKQRELTDA